MLLDISGCQPGGNPILASTIRGSSVGGAEAGAGAGIGAGGGTATTGAGRRARALSRKSRLIWSFLLSCG